MTHVDRLVVNAAEVVTCAGFSHAPARGSDQARLQVVRDGAVAIAGERIVAVGERARLERDYAVPAERVIDARGGVVLPGFVDPHTHLVFAGDRVAEWEERLHGRSYLDILRSGGGIASTVRATRQAPFETLFASARRRARLCLEHGTTTLEAKSGYCLDHDGELRLLEVAHAVESIESLAIVPTYLGAHVVPEEFASNRAGYVELCERTQTEAARRGLARFADVFCEADAFTLDETERLLSHARGLGLGVKVHAEQFSASGAARLGAELGATSLDHLEHLSDDDLAFLASLPRPPIAVLLPGVTFHLALERRAPARALIERGVPVALATDMNPGSSPTPSMPMIIALACRALALTVSECVVAATINAAHALGLARDRGSLEPGKRADLVICDVVDHRHLGYAFGTNPVSTVIVGGRILVDRFGAFNAR